jgi:predicted membrane protein
MHVDIVALQPLVTLLFGILILILPRLLNYLIAIYLILVGLVGLFPHLFSSLR